MRHSLFFGTCADADKVEAIVSDAVGNLIDCYQANDGETGTIEVRFFTDDRLDDFTQRYLIRKAQPETSALNCED